MTTKPKFVIADQALTSLIGHFYEYDLSVLQSIPQADYEPIVLGNIDADRELLSFCTPFFHCNFWAPSKNRRVEKPELIKSVPAAIPLEEPSISAQDQTDASLSPNPPPAAPLANPTIRSRVKATVKRMISLGKKIDGKVGNRWWGRLIMLPLKQLYWKIKANRNRKNESNSPLNLIPIDANPQNHESMPLEFELNETDEALRDIFFDDLVDLLQKYQLGPADILFIPNINQSSLAAIAMLLESLPPDQLPHLKLLIRRNVFSGRPTMEQYRSQDYMVRVFDYLFGRLEAYKSPKIQFYTDTDRLKDEFEVFTSFEFTVLPIPFRHTYIQPKENPGKPLRIVYLGNARTEKGFQYIPSLVVAMSDQIQANQVEFVLQAYPDPEPEILKAISWLRNRPGVTLLSEELTDLQYYQLLNSADILLLLYDPINYYSRSSCIFVESMVSATPFLTLEGSWMAHTMPAGTGEVAVSVDDLAKPMSKIVNNYEDYRQAIRRESEIWEKYHTPCNLVNMLLSNSKEQITSA